MPVYEGLQTFDIAALKFADKSPLDEEAVERAAANIAQVGLLAPPVVRLVGLKPVLLCGRHRVEALRRLAVEQVECRVITCSDAEAYAVTLSENAIRRHDKGIQVKVTHELIRQLAIVAEQSVPPDQRTPRAVRRELTRLAQRQLGIHPGALKKRLQYMAEHADEETTPEPPEPEGAKSKLQPAEPWNQRPPVDPSLLYQPPSKFEHWAIHLSEDYCSEVRGHQLDVDRLAGYLRRSIRVCDAIREAQGDVWDARIDTKLHEVLQLVKNARPAALCPYCKGQEGLQESCSGCSGRGWIPGHELLKVPHELLLGKPLKVMVRGEIVALASPDPWDDWGKP